MPLNSASGSTCTINLLPSPSVKLPCQEYLSQSIRNPKSGAVQEIVAIESLEASPFEIVLDVKPDSYSLLNPPTPQSTLLYHSKYGAFYDPQRPQTDDYLLEFFLDGVEIGISEQLRSNPGKMCVSQIASKNYSTCRPLQFAPVRLVDPDERAENSADRICQDKRVIDSLGTIRVDVRICTLVRRPTSVTDDKSPLQTTNQMRFSERSKKALLGSTAGLAQDVPAQYPRPEMEWKATNIYRHPFLQFIFRYKPRSILEAEGTIPQTIRQTEYPRPPSEIKNEGDDEHNVPTSDASRSRVKTEEEEKPLPRVYYVEISTDSEKERDEKKSKLKVIRVKVKETKKATTGKKVARSRYEKYKSNPESSTL
ncbi:hypothetical protein MJO28_000183 [Puccinia striiformis f. sp. tritici]|uniref:Uncharacterized protein n=1 Tax=Puccinia striiformis f. sp. tritici TaxID=168172 RepID=A0ACC0EZA9_9BASI|nr:hypothetical protein Pst134EB_002257 [Puccinia striiformis f. sp. tritici]KAI7962089.1 hypothetical protein MJO28_000183 [Puccinia striiformis f. sp. tritici]KAI7967770.1 hypothetical protein MJO29_001047 [Puccinia striiformis f. sp. tritici]